MRRASPLATSGSRASPRTASNLVTRRSVLVHGVISSSQRRFPAEAPVMSLSRAARSWASVATVAFLTLGMWVPGADAGQVTQGSDHYTVLVCQETTTTGVLYAEFAVSADEVSAYVLYPLENYQEQT